MLVQKLRNTESFSASSIGSVEVTVFDPDFNIYVSTNAEDRLVHLSRYNVLFARPNDEVTSQGPADTSVCAMPPFTFLCRKISQQLEHFGTLGNALWSLREK